MGQAERTRTKYLAVKLEAIRKSLNMTFEETITRLDCPNVPLYPASIYRYEKGEREPPLPVLLRYAQIANVYVEVLIDDKLELPKKLPAIEKNMGTKKI